MIGTSLKTTSSEHVQYPAITVCPTHTGQIMGDASYPEDPSVDFMGDFVFGLNYSLVSNKGYS